MKAWAEASGCGDLSCLEPCSDPSGVRTTPTPSPLPTAHAASPAPPPKSLSKAGLSLMRELAKSELPAHPTHLSQETNPNTPEFLRSLCPCKSLAFTHGSKTADPSSQPSASWTKPGCCLQSARARPACSHGSSPPGLVAEAAGAWWRWKHRAALANECQHCVAMAVPFKGLCSPGAPNHGALGQLGRNARAVVLFETGMVCMALCEVLDEQAGLSWSIYLLDKPSQVGVRGVTQKRCCLKMTHYYCRVCHPSTHPGEITWSPPTLDVVTTAYSPASLPLARVPWRALPRPLQQDASPPRGPLCRGLQPDTFGICSPCLQPKGGEGLRAAWARQRAAERHPASAGG